MGSKILLAAFVLLYIVALESIAPEGSDADSISEPTQFDVVVSVEGADTRVIRTLAQLKSDNSIAEISVIEVVTLEGKPYRGIRVTLKNSA